MSGRGRWIVERNEITKRYRLWDIWTGTALCDGKKFFTERGARRALDKAMKRLDKVTQRSSKKKRIERGWRRV